MIRFAITPPVQLLCAVLSGILASTDALATTKNGFDLDDASIPPEQILNGGPAKDGIPSLDKPEYVSAKDASFLKSKDRVLGIEFNGTTRAYPIKILNYHEIVNDFAGGKPIVITYCPLCGSGMAFIAEIGGSRLTFGVSGLLYNSDVLLYDRQSESLWSQIKSEAIAGTMKSTRLVAIPVSHTTWQDWHARHPDSQVLSTDTGYRRNYQVDPYPNYGRNGRLYFPVAEENKEYRRKSLVMGLEIDGRFKAYPFDELKRGPAQFADEFQEMHFEVQYDHKNKTARIIDARGQAIPTLIAFWFAWYAFHPDTEIYKAKQQ